MRLNRRGLTLLELVITIAIGSILLISFSRTVQALIETQARMRDSFIALNLAKLQLSIDNNAAYPGADSTTTLGADESITEFTIQRIYTKLAGNYDPPAANNSIIQVQFNISTPRSGTLISVNTYRTDTVSFGNGT